MKSVGIILLAGGGSTRMLGRDKVLETVRGAPLLVDRARMCLATDAAQLVVVTEPNKPDRRCALEGMSLEIIDNAGAHLGMAHSLKLGLKRITTDAVLIMLADMPDLTAADLDRVISRARKSAAPILRGTTQSGKQGHPVLIKRALFPEFNSLQGDQGAAPILAAHKNRLELVELDGDHAATDLDTPEAWVKWRREIT